MQNQLVDQPKIRMWGSPSGEIRLLRNLDTSVAIVMKLVLAHYLQTAVGQEGTPGIRAEPSIISNNLTVLSLTNLF